MKKQGLPSPVFEDSRGEFSVVLYNHSVPADAETEKPAAGLGDQVQDEIALYLTQHQIDRFGFTSFAH